MIAMYTNINSYYDKSISRAIELNALSQEYRNFRIFISFKNCFLLIQVEIKIFS